MEQESHQELYSDQNYEGPSEADWNLRSYLRLD